MCKSTEKFDLGVLVLAGSLIVDMLPCDELCFREEPEAFLARLVKSAIDTFVLPLANESTNFSTSSDSILEFDEIGDTFCSKGLLYVEYTWCDLHYSTTFL